jgi:four helix bundle protein
MIVWQMADKLDAMVQNVLNKIPRTEFKLREQLDSASDSVVSNFVEGYYSGSLAEYIKFCRYSKRSLGEVQQRVSRVLRKEYINDSQFQKVDEIAGKTMYLFNRLLDSLEKKRAFKKK